MMQNKSIKINLYGKEIIIEMKNGKFVKPEILNQILNGTSLKPAHEPIILARKPFEGTVAQNVLEHSTGAINIDGCRVDFSENDDTRIDKCYHHNALAGVSVGSHKENCSGKSIALYKNSGRWPANFIHDGSEEVLELFPHTESGKPSGLRKAHNNVYGTTGKAALLEGFDFIGIEKEDEYFQIAKARIENQTKGQE